MARKQSKNTANDIAREVWLAGLGAFSVAQKEGSKTFEKLVKEGGKVQKKTRKNVDKTVVDFREEVESRLNGAKEIAEGSFSKLEKIFEERVAQVLSRIGVPTSDDVQALAKRVAELNKQVKSLSGGRKVTARKKTTKKASRKTRARRRAA